MKILLANEKDILQIILIVLSKRYQNKKIIWIISKNQEDYLES